MPENTHILDTPIEFLKGVGPQRGDMLKKELGVFTFGQLLHHFPFRYIDKTQVHKVAEVQKDMPFIQVRGVLTSMGVSGQKWKKRLVARLKDDTGSVELVWFQGVSYMQKYLQKNAEYLVFGKPSVFKGKLTISHPEMELVTGQTLQLAQRMMPVYSSTEKLKTKGLDSKGIAKLMRELLSRLQPQHIPENMPVSLLQQKQLMSRFLAFTNLHQPTNYDIISKATYRLKFEEFFLIQLKLLEIKVIRKKLQGFLFSELGDYFNRFYNDKLPFELTGAQKRVLKEIRRDTLSGAQMNRLLQGDVGSGKTIVALIVMLIAIDNGFQACIMAPTEILAQQHFQTISEMAKGLGLKVALLTGNIKGATRTQLLKMLAAGDLDMLIGTHALIEESVVFRNLGVAVIDEQHRFGVAQRARLWKKNKLPPHVLVMTATPIPRTLAMTLYGDLDVSIIDELPPGRKAVVTSHKMDKDRLRVFGFIREQIEEGRQVYIVYPLIEESETLDYKDLMDGFESVKRAFPDNEIGIVHGRMKSVDKEWEMQRFAEGKSQIMVATTVIEVGVNVPNASVMIIESAERFGLSQLHQLRGRVGRGADQSFCILMTGEKLSNDARLRLRTMTQTNDGFKIAEVDLRLRGPGDIEGTQQSGIANLKLADITKDQMILQEARQAAADLLTKDPELSQPENRMLRYHLDKQKNTRGLSWDRIS